MTEIVNKLLLAGDKCMPEIHLRHLDLIIVLLDQLVEKNKEFKIDANRRYKLYLQE